MNPLQSTEVIEFALSEFGCRKIQALEPALDRQLERFSAVDFDPTRASAELFEIDRDFQLKQTHLRAAVVLGCARISELTLPPTVYPRVQLKLFLDEINGRGRRSPSKQLLAELRRRDPRGWSLLLAAAERLDDCSPQASIWPSPADAAACLRELGEVTPVLQAVVAERRRARSWGKDPAHLRAIYWRELFARTLSCLASPQLGPLRLWMNYLLALLDYFEKAIAHRARTGIDSPSARAIVVEEVYAFIYDHALSEAGGEVPTELLVGGHGRSRDRDRKNNQRARLKAQVCAIKQLLPERLTWTTDEHWREGVVPGVAGVIAKVTEPTPSPAIEPSRPSIALTPRASLGEVRREPQQQS